MNEATANVVILLLWGGLIPALIAILTMLAVLVYDVFVGGEVVISGFGEATRSTPELVVVVLVALILSMAIGRYMSTAKTGDADE